MRFHPAAILIFSILTGGLVANAQIGPPAIRLERSGSIPQLIVGDQPFLILGGELGNSSASSMDYLRPCWDHFRQMHLNTVVAPVYWELLEPEENRFDFALVDSLIDAASRHELKLVLLWFGTWKNSMSCYTPLWMKTDPKRFPRTADSAGRSQETFSVFGKETLEADKKAFAALMRHIREVDAAKHTVILVQVENEIGMLPTAREVSAVANSRYAAKIPAELAAYLKKNRDRLVPELQGPWVANGGKTDGSWEEVFGKGIATEERFQAWYYARYANEVALAGKKEYDLPMYVNAALPRPGVLPGKYPSAGPLPHLMDLWQAAAPAIDILSPDFYNPDTRYWCDLYMRNRNPLFIPEMRFDRSVAAKVFLVVGHYKALGFSPFSIESESDASLPLGRSYDLLQQLSPVITGRKWLGMEGFVFDGRNKTSTVTMGHYTITLAHYNTLPWAGGGKDSLWGLTGGMIIQTGEDEFLVAGTGFLASFSHIDPARVTNIASCDEVKFINGREVLGRRMNGDQDHQGRHVRFATEEWGIQKLHLYNSPRAIE
jgi:beta-galactosidase GanA